jgi:membrane protein DedA with SNARE-associated domain/rhodanese-related sulfurtransferase
MIGLITDYGLVLVFTNVLLERSGLPLPSTPALLIWGALAAEGRFSVWPVLAIALIACTIGDTLWYFAGRLYGRRIMKLLCRVSLSPDSCVRQTENRFGRWGRLTLVLAKFVPGLSTVARPLAGAMRVGLGSFQLLNGLGSVLWIVAAVGVGMLFHAQIAGLLVRVRELGTLAGALTLALLAGYIAYKWWERRRFSNMLGIPRITVDELRRGLAADDIVVVDVRSSVGRNEDRRRIPGALEIGLDEVTQRLGELPADREIVFYCACPNEASAAYAARKLIDLGYARARPLLGGLDAWIAAGYEVEDRLAARADTAPAVPLSPMPTAPRTSPSR